MLNIHQLEWNLNNFASIVWKIEMNGDDVGGHNEDQL